MSETQTEVLDTDIPDGLQQEVVVEEKPQAPVEEKPQPAKQTPWEARRIDQLTRQMREQERRAALVERQRDDLAARLAAAAAAGTAPELPQVPSQGGFTQQEFDRRVEERAAQDRFNAECNAINAAGMDAFPDFRDRIGGFSKIGGMDPTIIEIAQELGEPEKVLYELAGDLDEAARIMELSPGRRAAAIARFMGVKRTPQAPSKAPPPITPLQGTAVAEKDPEKMSTKEWMEWRKAQIKPR